MSIAPGLAPPLPNVSPPPPASPAPPPPLTPSPPPLNPPPSSVPPPLVPASPPLVIVSPPPPPLTPTPPPPIPSAPPLSPSPPLPSPSPPPLSPTPLPPSPAPPPLASRSPPPPIPSPPLASPSPPPPIPSPPLASPSPPPPIPSPPLASPSPPPPNPSPPLASPSPPLPIPSPPPLSPSPLPPSPPPQPPSPSPSPPPLASSPPLSPPASPPNLSPPPPSASPPPPNPPPSPSPSPSTPPESPPPPPSPPQSPPPPITASPPLFQSVPPPSPTISNAPRPPRSIKSPPTPLPPPSRTHAPPSHSSSSHISTSLIVGVVVGSVAVLAVFLLLWLLFARKKRKQDPRGSEGYYMPQDYHNGNGGLAQSGHQNNPSSAENFAVPRPSPPPVAAVPSISSSAMLSSTPPQPLSTNGSGGFWSNGSGQDNSLPSSSPGLVLGNMTSSFSYEELAVATNGFSDVNLLGQGGFGYVHKGVLPNGKIVAVKSLKADSGQGDREFQAEVETISRVHHKHLVSLVGYCITNSQKLLVYEFVANKTLEFHLHGKGQPVMDWPTRMKISVGAAKGLAYLHEDCNPKVIHRDIKAANILLDFNFEAKVADFGLAKFSSDANTHISTRVMGTFGYLAPEYASSGKLTEKSDIFSFGVLLLELITGRRPVDYTSQSEMEDSLVDWARPLFAKVLRDGNFDSLVDPRLENNYNYEEMGCMITCAASCVRHSAKRRPRMIQIVRALEGNLPLSELNDGVKPGFSSLQGSSDIDNGQYEEDMQRFRKMIYESEDDSSGQLAGTTSKYAWSKNKPNMEDKP